MTLGEIQEMTFNLREIIDEFNKNCMPNGYFICEEPDGTLLITDEETNIQTTVSQEFMSKTKLTKKEILALLERGSF
ncbi:hypothetical protein ABWE90_01425 [Pasteurella multocida]|uniref:hypothetical protein n=1 Tax=Pasteurella multocida TaxID=747 RepID=UPI000283918D|nr:hypothetical protein [Pasteurella multocida]ARB76451.1 hypothetical protein A6J57_09535 [Pasteurella multocida]EJZ80318.1 hypothetical protein P1059_00756 [Pasteurella multocida subsp. gallicida P1059]MEB3481313.1 hypothetical protein [Pasteurella multocida]NMR52063.1 hypothetical protein [Pasteurella multocida]NMR62003.1 hypothetical protein [Pasteurella multocida]